MSDLDKTKSFSGYVALCVGVVFTTVTVPPRLLLLKERPPNFYKANL